MDGKLFARKAPESSASYRKVLGFFDLTNIGIAAIIGAGIFVFLGKEAISTGPAVVIALILAGTAAILSALSYAEASAILPGSGSAYGFSYAALGNMPAFMVGWLYINGYVIGNAGVGTGWAEFFVAGVGNLGWDIGEQWTKSPLEGGLVNLPSLVFFLFITMLAMRAMKESTRINNVLVVAKIAIVLFVIIVGAFFLKPSNWQPFSPGGVAGIAGSTAVLFFAYLGFDTIAASGAEAKNPRRHMPKAILLSIGFCTVLYVLMALTVTGIAPSAALDGDAPVADAFSVAGAGWAAGVIIVGALIGLATVAYAFHMASARILQAMATDGFLPKGLAKMSDAGVPRRAALLVGVISAIAAGFLPLGLLIESSVQANIAIFITLSAGILVLRRLNGKPDGFSVPRVVHWAAIIALASVVIFGIDDMLTHGMFIVWLGLGLMIYGFWAHANSIKVAIARDELTAAQE